MSKIKDILRNAQRWSFITVLYKRRLRVHAVMQTAQGFPSPARQRYKSGPVPAPEMHIQNRL